MMLAKYNKLCVYDVRSIINIHKLKLKDPGMIVKLKSVTDSLNVEYIREYCKNKFNHRGFEKVDHHGILCCDREYFSGGLYSFINGTDVISLDISQGLLILFDPSVVTVKKHNIDEHVDNTVEGFRDVVILKN